MKLYLSPGACSLADHIALHEAGVKFDRVTVDLKTRRTEDGRDYDRLNPKGTVPALEFDDGVLLTENIAILSWVADQEPKLAPSGPLARYRLLEQLAFIATEIHKAFKPFFKADAAEAEKVSATAQITKSLGLVAARMTGDYLFGAQVTVADAYLFVMLRWARANRFVLPDPLPAYMDRMAARPAVSLALAHEGLDRAAA